MRIADDTLHLGGLKVTFHRTLRIPEDGKAHKLPPSLGAFPLRKVDDYKDRVPESWREHGGIFLPLWQREALWISFGADSKPVALKVAAGKINAVTGAEWNEDLKHLERATGDVESPEQDYLVCPPQPWIDGFNFRDGMIRQFIAMPLGKGYTVEGQVTGEEKFGGLQLLAFEPKEGGPADKDLNYRPRGAVGMSVGGAYKGGSQFSYASPGLYDAEFIHDGDASLGGAMMMAACASDDSGDLELVKYSAKINTETLSASLNGASEVMRRVTKVSSETRRRVAEKPREMGLGQGGMMKQKIYSDPYGVEAWDAGKKERVFVHIVNSELWKEITGEAVPPSPVSEKTYRQYGYPWFSLYDESVPSVGGSEVLAGTESVGAIDEVKDEVRDGNW